MHHHASKTPSFIFMRTIWKHGLEKEAILDLEDISYGWFLSPQNGMLLQCHIYLKQHKQHQQWMCRESRSLHPIKLGDYFMFSLSFSPSPSSPPLPLFLSFEYLHHSLQKEVNVSYSTGSLKDFWLIFSVF